MSDGTTTTGEHRRRTAIAYPSGRSMAGREVEVCYQCREAWPCENARLRERVAALEAAGNAMREAATNFNRGLVAAIDRWDAALAQAGEGGNA